jgi:hypothetical protein
MVSNPATSPERTVKSQGEAGVAGEGQESAVHVGKCQVEVSG